MQDDHPVEGEKNPIILPDGTKIRGSRKPRYDKVVHFLKRLSAVATKGDQHYSPRSWQRGNGEFIIDTINHAIEHIHKGIEGDTSEDHWVHAAFNCLMLDWFQQNKPEMVRELREKKELPPSRISVASST